MDVSSLSQIVQYSLFQALGVPRETRRSGREQRKRGGLAREHNSFLSLVPASFSFLSPAVCLRVSRMQAVPFWIVKRSREIGEREKKKKKKLERTSGRGLGERRERRGEERLGERGEAPSLFSFISPRSSLAAL